MLDWQDEFFASWLVQGSFPPVHTDLRCDTSKSCSHTASADWLSLSASSLSEHATEIKCNSGHFLKITAVQVWRHVVSSTVGLPLLPCLPPSVGSCLHSVIDDPCVSSSRVTFMATAYLRRNPVQVFLSGKGKIWLKYVRNSLSFSKCHSALYPKDLDGMSPR